MAMSKLYSHQIQSTNQMTFVYYNVHNMQIVCTQYWTVCDPIGAWPSPAAVAGWPPVNRCSSQCGTSGYESSEDVCPTSIEHGWVSV